MNFFLMGRKFYMKNILNVGKSKRSKKHNYLSSKAFLNGKKPGIFVNSGKIPCSWIRTPDPHPMRIQIKDSQITADPDP